MTWQRKISPYGRNDKSSNIVISTSGGREYAEMTSKGFDRFIAPIKIAAPLRQTVQDSYPWRHVAGRAG